MKQPKKILIITPAFGNTGSEVALANFINHAAGENFRFVVFVHWGKGNLKDSLLPGVKVAHPPFSRTFSGIRIMETLNRKIVSKIFLFWLKVLHKPAVIYINTLTLPHLLSGARSAGVPVILHTHELEHMLGILSEQQTREIIQIPTRIIAASQTAARIMTVLGRREALTTIYSSIRVAATMPAEKISESWREKLSIPGDSIIWLMAGTLDPNKNPGRFVYIASAYLKKRRRDHFVWVGSGSSGYFAYARKLSENLGVHANVHWISPANQQEYRTAFGLGNAFIITSNAESLSLVAVEALALGKPVVSFENGGISEILDAQTGVIIPRYDIDKCVRAMLDIASGKKRFAPKTLRERSKFFDIDTNGPLWSRLLSELVP